MPFNPERVNIKDLTIEEPEKSQELTFDPEKEITKEDWKMMKKELDKERELGNWARFLSVVRCMKILNPNYDFIIDKDTREGIYKELESYRKKSEWVIVTEMAMNMKMLDPTVTLNLDEFTQERMQKDAFKEHNKVWTDYIDQLMALKVFDQKLEVHLGTEGLEKMDLNLNVSKAKEQWEEFAELAAAEKVINMSLNVEVSPTEWQNMKNILENYREKHREKGEFYEKAFTNMASWMKILAAEKVEVTNDGLEITMPKKVKSEPKSEPLPFPEKRNF